MRLFITTILFLMTTLQMQGQESNRLEGIVPMRRTSGIVTNETRSRATIYKEAIVVEDATSMRLQFGRVTLGAAPTNGAPTLLRITSYEDGSVQHFTSETLKQWNYSSAWFNGSIVLIEIIADPLADKSHFELRHVLIETLIEDRSICGPLDNRILSDDPKTGRIFPIGCTAWIIDDPNRCLLSAGHCTGAVDVMQFNVPLSNSNGSWQHPGPEDQYMVDPDSLQFVNNTIGDDWAYFGCFPNTETGLTPGQAQEDWFTLAHAAPPVNNQTLRITGYGTTSSPVDPSWNSAQKTHTGLYKTLSGNSIAYTVDTTGGNSGSAVLNEVTGEAIGIHTNAGCNASGGQNWGCAIHNSGLQYALANPQGVCIPANSLNFGFPDGLLKSVIPNTLTPLIFTVTSGLEQPVPDNISFRVMVNGIPQTLSVFNLGDDRYKVNLPGQICDTTFGFYITAVGDEGTTATFPPNAPDQIHNVLVGELQETVLMDVSFSFGLPTTWAAEDLWHASTTCSPSGSCDDGMFMYFGIDDSCEYDNGSTVTGSLISPAFDITNLGDTFTLSFCYALATEEYDGYDTAEVFANDVLVATLQESSGWAEETIEITNVSGHSLEISWKFDSIDDMYNNFQGLHIDGVTLIAEEVSCESIPCLGDLNQDGQVNISDLLSLIDVWGATDSSADIDGNGIVDVTDMLMLISAWGECQ